MSKQSEAKQAQGYEQRHIVPICMAIANIAIRNWLEKLSKAL